MIGIVVKTKYDYILILNTKKNFQKNTSLFISDNSTIYHTMSEVPSLDTETQKSYKEYLLKQLLDNPQSLGLDMMGNKDNKNEGMKHNHHTPNVELKLDSIGNKKVDGTKNDTGISNTNVINMEHIEKKQIDYDWSKQYDQSSCCYYYYNFRTGLSQWEQPDNYMDTSQYSSFSSAVPVASDATSTAAVATFNARTGSFTSSGIDSYWQQVGRQTDREGRQMSGI